MFLKIIEIEIVDKIVLKIIAYENNNYKTISPRLIKFHTEQKITFHQHTHSQFPNNQTPTNTKNYHKFT